MKAYLGFTALVFGLLSVVHVWRMVIEPASRGPLVIGVTALSAVLCLWAIRLLSSSRHVVDR